MIQISAAKQAQLVIDGQRAAIAFLDSLRTTAPQGDELTAIIKTYSYPIAETDRLFLKGFVRQIQKFIEQAAAQKKGISL